MHTFMHTERRRPTIIIAMYIHERIYVDRYPHHKSITVTKALPQSVHKYAGLEHDKDRFCHST